MWYADKHYNKCHTFAKESSGLNFNSTVIYKISNVNYITSNFTYSQNYIFWNLLDQLIHPCKFHGRYISGMYFYIFASCELLIQ